MRNVHKTLLMDIFLAHRERTPFMSAAPSSPWLIIIRISRTYVQCQLDRLLLQVHLKDIFPCDINHRNKYYKIFTYFTVMIICCAQRNLFNIRNIECFIRQNGKTFCLRFFFFKLCHHKLKLLDCVCIIIFELLD